MGSLNEFSDLVTQHLFKAIKTTFKPAPSSSTRSLLVAESKQDTHQSSVVETEGVTHSFCNNCLSTGSHAAISNISLVVWYVFGCLTGHVAPHSSSFAFPILTF